MVILTISRTNGELQLYNHLHRRSQGRRGDRHDPQRSGTRQSQTRRADHLHVQSPGKCAQLISRYRRRQCRRPVLVYLAGIAYANRYPASRQPKTLTSTMKRTGRAGSAHDNHEPAPQNAHHRYGHGYTDPITQARRMTTSLPQGRFHIYRFTNRTKRNPKMTVLLQACHRGLKKY